MAVAKLVCGDCGETLAPSDVRCPSCGASIEKEESPPPVPALRAVPVLCGACGQSNPPGTEFCGSCGARLGSRSAAKRAKKERDGAPRDAGKRDREKGAANVGIWQIISVVAVLALLGYLVYDQVREGKTASQGASETGVTGEGGAPAAISPQSADLKPLEDAVRENPKDPVAQLRLANAYNDSQLLAQAIEGYRKYLAMKPKDPDARTDFAICFFKQAQSDSLHRDALLREAVREMETAFTSAPRPHQPSAFNLGIVYLHLDDMDSSNIWFRKAMEINPESELGRRAQNMITQHTVPQ